MPYRESSSDHLIIKGNTFLHYKQLFYSSQEGFAVHELLCDEAYRPIDYRFLDVNPAFEQ